MAAKIDRASRPNINNAIIKTDTYTHLSNYFMKSDTIPADLYPDGPRMLADIGGTNARFALEGSPGKIDHVITLACAEYPEFVDAMRAYLERCQCSAIQHAIVAIANPVLGDQVKMTNHHWQFSIEATRQQLKFQTLLIVNDFTALAMALPILPHEHVEKIGGGSSRSQGVIGLLGAGTGLGVGGLIPIDGRWHPIESEGGHVAFSPADERELSVLQYCWKQHDHVSAERLVSGPGIALIYQAIAVQHTASPERSLSTVDIVARALDGTDALCIETLDCFCGMLGTVAANLAVTLGAQGGIYIGGGVVPRLGGYFATSSFRRRFESKGRLSSFTAQIPTLVITAPYPALLGAAAILNDHLTKNTVNAPELAQPSPHHLTESGMRS